MKKSITCLSTVMLALNVIPINAAPISALQDGLLGLYNAADMQVINATKCTTCPTIPQALWYFEKDTIAVAKSNMLISGFSTTLNAQDDVKTWLKTVSPEDLKAMSPLVWLGSTQVIQQARVATDGKSIRLGEGESLPFSITPKIASNLSYWDASTLAFFNQREVRLRDEQLANKEFVARTVWPLDYKLSADVLNPLKENESLASLVRFENGGAKS